MLFEKYQSAGNDFIIIDGLSVGVNISPSLIKSFCDRGFGIGADGLMIARRTGTGAFDMDFNNPDGTKAEMCGNGIRCFVRFLLDKGYVREGSVDISTGAGVKTVRFGFEGNVFQATVTIGNAEFENSRIPASDDAIDQVKDYLSGEGIDAIDVVLVSVGNPHCIVFVDSLKRIDLGSMGSHIEKMECFPNKINVEFSQIIGRSEVDTIVWERGAGRTLACGTGATAVAAASTDLGFTDELVNVNLPGGTLVITCKKGEPLTLTGGAEHVFSGETRSWLGV